MRRRLTRAFKKSVNVRSPTCGDLREGGRERGREGSERPVYLDWTFAAGKFKREVRTMTILEVHSRGRGGREGGDNVPECDAVDFDVTVVLDHEGGGHL